ncbi:zinc ribbon domain-containing protein [Rhodomicrobium sp. Az07]|uniref:FmdB family zinc ribbon protein n=1 Tax=Rhodomicrobium sp. Az07 TaxID=2839034 RepID=UPI001BE88CA8|nr:zinc ribbon domain-containing protein [Rhodomicrobium sp. Az07]MBT3070562.1 zinc ribbon domain-containing protein [Rhodomicrobium sp. Az07]
MPLYSFQCPDCGKETEMLVAFGDTPPCPACGSAAMTRLLSRVAPHANADGAGTPCAQAARDGALASFSPSECRGCACHQ